MKKLQYTPNSKITVWLRRLWLYSRERAKAIKIYNKKCEICGIGENIEVHHTKGINWEKIIKPIRNELLVKPAKLQCLCKGCHKKITFERKK